MTLSRMRQNSSLAPHRCVLDGSRLHTITTESCVVWNASGLVQLVDGHWLQERNILGKRLVSQGDNSDMMATKSRTSRCHLFAQTASRTSLSGNLAKRSGEVGTVDMSVQFANTCSTRSTGVRRRQNPFVCCFGDNSHHRDARHSRHRED